MQPPFSRWLRIEIIRGKLSWGVCITLPLYNMHCGTFFEEISHSEIFFKVRYIFEKIELGR